MRNQSISLIVAVILSIFIPIKAQGSDISGPDVKIQGNEIIVSTVYHEKPAMETEIKSGVEKELIFSVELFRVWSFWPNEFVKGKNFQKIIQYNNLKEKYWASSFDGTYLREKTFKDYSTMKNWVFTVNDVKLANIKELEPGKYFVRVTIESRLRKLPPLIGYLLFFIRETEFKVSQDSPSFNIQENR
ncbi:MAG: DUF4390 domain-containing protein [Nitrospirae bacterium]|nr:DUF4390 domain-containing protein [Nitrospirota bacterium]